ncbi:class I SAM-dependent methyltransferase [Streptacidiphilus sp. 4-A2]|nr:class I SAM-dependent methyltransferase [Streptacidiphilus sp. 4-A2]
MDIHPELVSAAAKLVPGGEFRVGNAVDTATLPTGPFDVVFMLTLHSHFDDPARWIDSIDHLLGERGRAYVFGLFNRSPVDVVIRMNDVANGTGWLTGWNQFSEATVGRLAAERGFEYRFHEYTPIARVEKDGADSLRSHTVSIDGSSALTFVNGSQMLHRFALLEMKRSC